MNIWLINQYAVPPSEPGGTRHFAFAKKLMERGHRVLIVASSFNHTLRKETRPMEGGVYRYEEIDGVPFLWIRTPSYSGNTLARVWNMSVFAWRVSQLVTSPLLKNWGKPDVVWASSPHLFAGLVGDRLARRFKVPFLFEVRDLWPESLVALGDIPRWHPFILMLERIERHLYQRADRIISLLPLAHLYMEAKGAEPSKITWIPNGIDLDMVPSPIPSEPRDKFTVMYAGTHGLANHLDLVLEAAFLVAQKDTDRFIRFRFVGDGPEKRRLREKAQKLGLRNVSFEDGVPKSQIYNILSSADVLVISFKDSPLYRWGVSPNKLFDYLAVARPIIFAGSTPKNYVEEAGAGIAVQGDDPVALAEAILKMATLSPQGRWEMGLRGRRYVEREFDFKILTDKLEAVLKDMVAARGVKITEAKVDR